MKITKRQLRRIIKEETARHLNEITPGAAGIASAGGGTPADQGFAAAADDRVKKRPGDYDDSAESDILDAINMLENEEDPHGTLFYVINRLHTALEKL